MNAKIYIHEFIDIIGHNRARYMHHMTANWCPVAREERNQLCFGVWGTLGSTGRWPEVVNMWELDGWDGRAANLAHEVSRPTLQDACLRSGGRSRPTSGAGAWTASSSPSRGLRRSTSATRPACAARSTASSCTHCRRVRCAGSSTAYDSEAIVIWAIPAWPTWTRFEQAWETEPLSAWQQWLVGLGADVKRTLMNDAPLSPLRLGRQPSVEDRRPLSEIGP